MDRLFAPMRIKRLIPTSIRQELRLWSRGWLYRSASKTGHLTPLSYEAKRQIILEYARRSNAEIFVETGTYEGDTVDVVREHFRQVMSIELHHELARRAQARFASVPNVTIVEGDSAEQLKEIVPRLSETALFWLDGHYSSGDTAKGKTETPIIEELCVVLASPLNHTVLIDDARLYTGEGDYPSLHTLRRVVRRLKPAYAFSIQHDVVRLHPTLQAAVN